MSGVGGLFIFQCFYTEVGEKGGGGGWGTVVHQKGILMNFHVHLLSLAISKNLRKQKRLWTQELKNCVFGSDIDQFLCMIHKKITLIYI